MAKQQPRGRGHAAKIRHEPSHLIENKYASEPGIHAITPVDWEATKPGIVNPHDSYATTRTDSKGRPTWLA